MERTLTLLALGLSTALAHAQCTDLPIPDGTTVVSTSGTVEPPPGPVWICGGLDVTVLGDFHNLYVEANSTVQVSGAFNSGYMKGPGSLTTNCDTCFWQFEPTVDFVPMGGELNVGLPCDPVTFNYADAPSPGCPGVTAVDEVAARDVHVELFPSPAHDRLTVQLTGAVARSLEVTDMTGRTVLRTGATHDGVYDVSALHSGSYVARVLTDRGTVTRRFLKQ